MLSWVGDHFQIPTVGIAVDPARIPLDDPALQALVRANRRTLVTIAEQPRLAVDYIASFLGRLTSEEAQQYYERYIGPHPLTRCTSRPCDRAVRTRAWNASCSPGTPPSPANI